ncbi:MAG: glycosyltransferase [Bacteroidetes bacterium]|nr:glycosyltransferase [Bacteroidota bacterium]
MPEHFGFEKKISIIVPTLNEEKYLGRLLSQFDEKLKKNFDLELIISDGGSKDLTVEIANKYADRIISHTEETPQNISQGRNAGADNSLGDVLIFLNADTYIKDIDFLLKESLTELFFNDITAIACPIFVFPEEEKFSDKTFHFFYNHFSSMLNKYFMGMGRGECHIIRKDKFLQAGGYDENLAAGEDYELYVRLKKIGKLKFRHDFIVYESPRRYRKFGYRRVFWDWAKNSVSVTLFKRSISKSWEAVR